MLENVQPKNYIPYLHFDQQFFKLMNQKLRKYNYLKNSVYSIKYEALTIKSTVGLFGLQDSLNGTNPTPDLSCLHLKR